MSVPRLDLGAPGLVLAPHLSYPTRDGADISLDRVARHLSRHLPFVDLLAADVVIRFEGGDVVNREPFENALRSQRSGAIRSIVHRSHYLLERFLTERFRDEALERLRNPRYHFVLYSYVCTASLAKLVAPQTQRLSAVWTHNDQVKWFRNLRRTFRNPVLKLVSFLSERWYPEFFREHAHDFVYLYVTPEDRDGHVRALGPHANLIVPIGADVDEHLPERSPKAADDIIRLIFVGSLGARMNLDALQHFADTFAPAIKNRLGNSPQVVIAGSNPSPTVKSLCERSGWELRPNVSDEELSALYASSSFALLPFPYTTGAKLKLLGALAHGTPFLATTGVGAQVSEPPPGCVISDAADVWATHIESAPRPAEVLRRSLHELARQHDWQFVVERMVHMLTEGAFDADPARKEAARDRQVL